MTGWSGPKHQQNKTDKFLSLICTLYVLGNSQKNKGKVLKKHILKYFKPRGFDARTAEIQEKNYQRATQLQQSITDCSNRIQGIQYQNVGLQGKNEAKGCEAVALHHQATQLQRGHVGCVGNEDKNNSTTFIEKSNEAAEYPYISKCWQHGYKKHATSVWLVCNQGSTLFADGDTPYATVTYNFWREHRLIVVDPNRPRYFRLDAINWERLLVLNDA